jgi:CYTH domain-containing protein
MPKERLERKPEKIKPPKIEEEELLDAVLRGEETQPDEYEIERRYLPTRLLSIEELERLSKGKKREISQGYVQAQDATGELESFRLRVTNESGGEGILYRIAKKLKIERSRARIERQVNFSPEDSDAQEFERLWKAHVNQQQIVHKTRYYIDWKLPNGNMTEIHYDIHHGRDMEGVVRIEIEFKGDHADVDDREVGDSLDPKLLPKWIGDEITNDARFGGRTIAQHGFPNNEERILRYPANHSPGLQSKYWDFLKAA